MKFFSKKSEFFVRFHETHQHLKEVCALLSEFSAKFEHSEEYAKKAKEIENRADTSTHQIIDTLNKLFITPFDREDIYLLAHEFDDIIDLIENVTKKIHLYGLKEQMDFFPKFALLIEQGAVALGEMLTHLEKMEHSSKLVEVKISIHKLEDEGDALFDTHMQQLFSQEENPILLLKKKEILEGLEDVMDKYQKISNIIEGIIVKSS